MLRDTALLLSAGAIVVTAPRPSRACRSTAMPVDSMPSSLVRRMRATMGVFYPTRRGPKDTAAARRRRGRCRCILDIRDHLSPPPDPLPHPAPHDAARRQPRRLPRRRLSARLHSRHRVRVAAVRVPPDPRHGLLLRIRQSRRHVLARELLRALVQPASPRPPRSLYVRPCWAPRCSSSRSAPRPGPAQASRGARAPRRLVTDRQTHGALQLRQLP